MTEENHNHLHNHTHSLNRPENTQDDTAQHDDSGYKFLSDALRASFILLKIIMVILLVLFLISGFQTIGPDEKGLVLTFGKIRGEGERRVLNPGLTWIWPYPIEELIKIPVAKKTNLAFEGLWYYQTPQEKLNPQARPNIPDTLNPIRDGYSITRSQKQDILGSAESDYNIVHSKWQLTYQIRDAELFFTNTYVNFDDIQAGQNYSDVIVQNINPMLRDLMADAVIATLVNYTIDDVLFEQIGTITEHVKRLLQDKLDDIDSGIAVVSVQLDDKVWPRQVNDAFWASIQATNLKEKVVSDARSYYDQTLNEVAGQNAAQLLDAIEKGVWDTDEAEPLWLLLAGKSQDVIAQAQAYRTKVVEEARANAEYFRNLLPEYRERPELVVQKIYQDTVQSVLENAEEKIIVQTTQGTRGKEIRIQMNRDPLAVKESENKEQSDK